MLQGTSLYNYFYISNKKKCCVFLFIFYLFSSAKLKNRRAEQVLPRGNCWHQWERGGDRERR
jgi:hypothetical protein